MTQVFSAHRHQRLEAELLEDPNLTFKRCGPLNPATLLPELPVPLDQHSCVEVVSSVLQVRANLFDEPLDNPDCIFFSDGSSFYIDGPRFTGYTITSEWDILEAASLPGNWGAQTAELYALAQACQLAAVKACSTCQRNGPALPLKTPKGGKPLPAAPFQHLKIDFADMPKAFGKKHLLVLVCPLTSWVEAFPTANCTTSTVAKILLKDIVPRFGIPLVLDSDCGPHFTGHVLGCIEQGLGILHSFHTPYHPQSSGKVERMNRDIKSTLAKYCQETGLKWPQVLPLVLFHLRTRPTRVLGLSPFELLYRHLPFKGGTFPRADVSLLGVGSHDRFSVSLLTGPASYPVEGFTAFPDCATKGTDSSVSAGRLCLG
ncbi:KRAB-A domain-containing protein 2-like [Macrochelys suwanniensis]